MAKRKQYSVWITVEESNDNEISRTVTQMKLDEFNAKSVADAIATCLVSYHDRELKPKPKPK
jgi:hypothetical protein